MSKNSKMFERANKSYSKLARRLA